LARPFLDKDTPLFVAFAFFTGKRMMAHPLVKD
jgi:hypothetical protein